MSVHNKKKTIGMVARNSSKLIGLLLQRVDKLGFGYVLIVGTAESRPYGKTGAAAAIVPSRGIGYGKAFAAR